MIDSREKKVKKYGQQARPALRHSVLSSASRSRKRRKGKEKRRKRWIIKKSPSPLRFVSLSPSSSRDTLAILAFCLSTSPLVLYGMCFVKPPYCWRLEMEMMRLQFPFSSLSPHPSRFSSLFSHDFVFSTLFGQCSLYLFRRTASFKDGNASAREEEGVPR